MGHTTALTFNSKHTTSTRNKTTLTFTKNKAFTPHSMLSQSGIPNTNKTRKKRQESKRKCTPFVGEGEEGKSEEKERERETERKQ